MLKKLAIGTVQFGIPYGINNSIGIPSSSDVKEIFKIANQASIDTLDTAHLYGDAEIKIGQLAEQKFKIVTKFSSVKNKEELNIELMTSLSKLQLNAIYGYLAHNADTLIENPSLWQALKKAKENKLVEKIGYSLYSTQQLEKLLDLHFIPDLVQLPYSLLDRKFEHFLPQLKKLGTEIHVRSVFLQGLYFMDVLNLPAKLQPLKSNLQQLKNYCKEFNIPIASLALNFALTNNSIDKVVIGVDSPLQLQQNIDAVKLWKHHQQLIDYVHKIEVINKELLNPINWK
jgi:aryl-alcohol dehydrogenase-like predicted oxidoreductase